MVIENKSLEVFVFYLIIIRELIGCFFFIKGGNVFEELMSFFFSFRGVYKVFLK